MAKSFGTKQKLGGAFKASSLDVTLTLPGGGGPKSLVGLMFQNMAMQYQRNLSEFYEIGSENVYRVEGRGSGNLSIARLGGPTQEILAALDAMLDVCKNVDITYKIASGDSCQFANGTGTGTNPVARVGGGGLNVANTANTLIGVSAIAIGNTVNAQDIVAQENMTFKFLDLEYGGG